ncbi:hypothetical protein IMZ48_09255 [Candidatus Bathyarchaeota archaeon]|nr:hypothetical protein [Candidatus Bathyarchaeota archaeon]
MFALAKHTDIAARSPWNVGGCAVPPGFVSRHPACKTGMVRRSSNRQGRDTACLTG